MKAIICENFGEVSNVVWGNLSVPIPAPDEVLIRVKYAGVNYPDTLIVQGKYQFTPEFPFVPGGELSGEVVAIGSAVEKLKLGDRVVAAMGWGAFGELAVAKGSNTFLLPEETDMEAAACLLETYATTLHALKDRAVLRTGEQLVVLGAAGGTGTAAMQIGRCFGAKVIACVSDGEKAAYCKEQGADDVIIYSRENLKHAIKNIGGADVIFDPVGGDYSEQAFRAINPGGRHLVVGFATGSIPKMPWNLPLLKSASIVGVFWGGFWRSQPKENRRNVKLLLKWLQAEKVMPQITSKLSMDLAAEALEAIQQRKVKGKIVLKFPEVSS